MFSLASTIVVFFLLPKIACTTEAQRTQSSASAAQVWSRSTPKSNGLSLRPCPHIQTKSILNFFSHLCNRQSNECRQKHDLLGGGNNFIFKGKHVQLHKEHYVPQMRFPLFQFKSGLLHQTHNKSPERQWNGSVAAKVSLFLLRAITFKEHSRRSLQDQIWFSVSKAEPCTSSRPSWAARLASSRIWKSRTFAWSIRRMYISL